MVEMYYSESSGKYIPIKDMHTDHIKRAIAKSERSGWIDTVLDALKDELKVRQEEDAKNNQQMTTLHQVLRDAGAFCIVWADNDVVGKAIMKVPGLCEAFQTVHNFMADYDGLTVNKKLNLITMEQPNEVKMTDTEILEHVLNQPTTQVQEPQEVMQISEDIKTTLINETISGNNTPVVEPAVQPVNFTASFDSLPGATNLKNTFIKSLEENYGVTDVYALVGYSLQDCCMFRYINPEILRALCLMMGALELSFLPLAESKLKNDLCLPVKAGVESRKKSNEDFLNKAAEDTVTVASSLSLPVEIYNQVAQPILNKLRRRTRAVADTYVRSITTRRMTAQQRDAAIDAINCSRPLKASIRELVNATRETFLSTKHMYLKSHNKVKTHVVASNALAPTQLEFVLTEAAPQTPAAEDIKI